MARWNHGYYFCKCRRCGTDLVRTTYGPWQEPKGFRVVWQAKPPADAEAVRLEPIPASALDSDKAGDDPPALPLVPPIDKDGAHEPAQPVDLSKRGEPLPPVEPPRPTEPPQPVQPVEPLTPPQPIEPPPVAPGKPPAAPPPPGGADARSDDTVARAEENPAPAPAPEAAHQRTPPRRSYAIPDFMDDAAERVPMPAAPLDPPPVQPAQAPGEQPILPPFLAQRQAFSDGARRQLERYRERRATVVTGEELARMEAQHMGSPAIAFLASVVIIALIIFLAGRPASPPAQPVSSNTPKASKVAAVAPSSAPAQVPAGGGNAAYVTASILSCRAAPAPEARRIRNIVRGEPVTVLAGDAEWVSVSYRGRQCWVLARYLSRAEPLTASPDIRGWAAPDENGAI